MQITIPDDPLLQKRADAAGFERIEEYVLNLIEQEAELDNEFTGETISPEEWSQGFRAFLATLPCSNPHFDDSRESIYPVR